MGSDDSARTEADAGSPGPKPMSARRKRRLIAVVAVIAVALIVIVWGWSSTGGSFVDVSEVVDASSTSVPAKYLGRIDLRGDVADWDGGADLVFRLVDSASPAKSIDVTMLGTLPEGFENGKTVVAKGELDATLPLHLTATEITVGCSSKY